MEEEQGGRPIKYLRDANLIGEAEIGLLVEERRHGHELIDRRG